MSQGYQWGSWTTETNAAAVTDANSSTTDEIDIDGAAACEVAVTTVEDNTGATDGDIEVYVLRYGATGWQTKDDAALVLSYAQDQDTTHHKAFAVDPGDTGSFKVLAYNDCGQTVALSVTYRTATIGAA